MSVKSITSAGEDVMNAYGLKWRKFRSTDIKYVYCGIKLEGEGELPNEEEFNSLLTIQFEKYLMEELRHERNKRLTACDWTQNKDVVLSEDEMKVWSEYRKELRDLPSKVELKDGVDMEALFPNVPNKNVISKPVIPIKVVEEKEEEEEEEEKEKEEEKEE